eukprot:gene13030-15393_t
MGNWEKFAITSAAMLVFGSAVDLYRFLTSIQPDSIGRWRDLLDTKESKPSLAGSAGDPTVIYDVRGRVVATLSTDQGPPRKGALQLTEVTLSEVSDRMWQAVVASEDHRFFHHSGLDVRGLTRAVGSLGTQGGGSTITQQLVKNLLLSQAMKQVVYRMVATGHLEAEEADTVLNNPLPETLALSPQSTPTARLAKQRLPMTGPGDANFTHPMMSFI